MKLSFSWKFLFDKFKNLDKWKKYTFYFFIFVISFSILTPESVESKQHSTSYSRISFEETRRYQKNIIVEKGDTLASIFDDIGVDNNQAYSIIQSLSTVFRLTSLKAGKSLKLVIYENGKDAPSVELLKLEKSLGKEIRVALGQNGTYSTKIIDIETLSFTIAANGVIKNSLFSDAADAGIPDTATMELFHLFSYDVDFQRDIYKGDTFKVLFENMINTDGEVISKGDIIFAQLKMSKKDLKIYRFKDDKGKIDYFDEKGINIRKTLLKTPILGARISSRFGKRTHPIEGYSHYHQALDFAAPKNTPIMAAGSGTVELAGWNGGFGNCVIIRHANQYKTLYAHMNAFANGVKKGRKVKQGQIIGYVGTTGVSTGNHLHYEVIFRGKKINPSYMKTPPEKKLTEEELKRFLEEAKKIDKESNTLFSI